MAKTEKELAAEVAAETRERYVEGLQNEREGYERRHAAARTDEDKAAMADRVKQVDEQIKLAKTQPRERTSGATNKT